jgi:hypothetical protein
MTRQPSARRWSAQTLIEESRSLWAAAVVLDGRSQQARQYKRLARLLVWAAANLNPEIADPHVPVRTGSQP